jgi:hypothetical protein
MIHLLNEACHPLQNFSSEELLDIHLNIFSGASVPEINNNN